MPLLTLVLGLILVRKLGGWLPDTRWLLLLISLKCSKWQEDLGLEHGQPSLVGLGGEDDGGRKGITT